MNNEEIPMMTGTASVFDIKAREVSGYLVHSHGMESSIVGDTPFLDFLRELFQQLLPILLSCLPMAKRTPDGVAAKVKDMNWFERIQLRTHIRRKLRDEDGERRLLVPLSDAIVKMGAGCTVDDAAQAMREVR